MRNCLKYFRFVSLLLISCSLLMSVLLLNRRTALLDRGKSIDIAAAPFQENSSYSEIPESSLDHNSSESDTETSGNFERTSLLPVLLHSKAFPLSEASPPPWTTFNSPKVNCEDPDIQFTSADGTQPDISFYCHMEAVCVVNNQILVPNKTIQVDFQRSLLLLYGSVIFRIYPGIGLRSRGGLAPLELKQLHLTVFTWSW